MRAFPNLIARGFEVPGWTLLPGDRGLATLLHQATEAYLCSAQEFGIPGFNKGSQEDIERPVCVGACKDALGDRIDWGMS